MCNYHAANQCGHTTMAQGCVVVAMGAPISPTEACAHWALPHTHNHANAYTAAHNKRNDKPTPCNHKLCWQHATHTSISSPAPHTTTAHAPTRPRDEIKRARKAGDIDVSRWGGRGHTCLEHPNCNEHEPVKPDVYCHGCAAERGNGWYHLACWARKHVCMRVE